VLESASLVTEIGGVAADSGLLCSILQALGEVGSPL